MHKRILRVAVCLCAVVTVLLSSVGSAFAWSTGDTPRVINWKDYVISSEYYPGGTPGYETWEYTASLPTEFIWHVKLHESSTNITNLPIPSFSNDYVRYGATTGDGNYVGDVTGDFESFYHLEFQAETDYILSVEDLLPLDDMYMEFTIYDDSNDEFVPTTIALTFYLRFWDSNFNYLYDVAVYSTSQEVIMENIIVPFELYTDPTDSQPPYISFIVQYDYYGQTYDWDATKFNWTFHSNYKTPDAPDAGGDTGGNTGGNTGGDTGGDTGSDDDSAIEDILTGDYPATPPDDGGTMDDYIDYEQGLLDSIEDGFDQFFNTLQNGLTFLAQYNLVFISISRMCAQFFGYGWISNLLTVSLSIGIVGVLLGVAPSFIKRGGKE